MTLTETQQDAVRQWAADGLGLSDIQKQLREKFDLTLTYMDVRFLIIDLGVVLKDNQPEAASKADEAAVSDTDTDVPDDALAPDFDEADTLGGVSLTTDRIMRPGAVASGEVTFSDGRHGRWMLDQMGRLALDMDGDAGYRPSPADIQDFQQKLQQALTPGGF